MSAIGTKRTSASALHMSAFGGKADITQGSFLLKSHPVIIPIPTDKIACSHGKIPCCAKNNSLFSFLV
jgi:hypothetical protein